MSAGSAVQRIGVVGPWLLAAALAAAALGPASTKIAGLAWALLCVAGLAVALRRRLAEGNAVAHATQAWAWACTAGVLLGAIKVLWWGDPWDGLNAEMRLALAAWATHALARWQPQDGPLQARRIVYAAAAQCAVAAACAVAITAYAIGRPINPRELFTSNAIPWGVAVALALCVLAPVWVARPAPGSRRLRIVCAAAMACGLLAIGLSRSRGAFTVLPWLLCLLAMGWRERHGRMRPTVLAGIAALVASAALAAWWAPGDPVRVRLAQREIHGALAYGEFNNSMGNRVYLWGVAWDGFLHNPWLGVGATERLRRIKSAGMEGPVARQGHFDHVRSMGHVHNQFLHAAFDGGLLYLASTLAFVAGLAVAARRLIRIDRTAGLQLTGIAVVHVLAGLTNVNFAHNYYAVSLALAVAAVMLGAAWRRTGPV